MAWHKRSAASTGAAFFRGAITPRQNEFDFLTKAAITVAPMAAEDHEAWAVRLRHADWGDARLSAPRQPVPIPKPMITFDNRLDDAERAEAMLGRSSVMVRTEGERGDVLRDRKRLLRYLAAVLGDDGLVAYDATAMRVWSRPALADELAHDADLDIDSLFTVHNIYKTWDGGDEQDRVVHWYHTHGLAEIGFFDFDILRPHPELLTARCHDFGRAVAFAIVEGKVQPSTDAAKLTSGGPLRLVDVAEFNRRASAADRGLRDDDERHNRDRTVLCDPAPAAGHLRRKLFGVPARPSRLLSADPGEFLAYFPTDASRLMARRARQTFARFRHLHDELADLAFKPIVKLGYQVDGGDADDLEHLWFEVNAIHDDAVDATLMNTPHNVAALTAGDRGTHAVDRLTDWALIGPTGMVTPRDTRPARSARAHREPILKMLAEREA